jgi:hypothetical protein
MTLRLTDGEYRNLKMADLICADCGKSCQRRGAVQRYCRDCSEARDRERKRRWAADHPKTAEEVNRKASKDRVRTRANGVVLSGAAASTIGWSAEPDLAWMVRVSHPFDYGMSKNAIYRMGQKGHVSLREESRSLRHALAMELRVALGVRRAVEGKLWIDILVQKPNHKGDAVNVVDTVCDAIKMVVGIDDRWYSIRRLDWEVVKVNPRIFVGVGQEVTEPHRVCSTCGRIQPHSEFWGKKRLGRECKHCRTGVVVNESQVPAREAAI